jgi:hypothetical protein
MKFCNKSNSMRSVSTKLLRRNISACFCHVVVSSRNWLVRPMPAGFSGCLADLGTCQISTLAALGCREAEISCSRLDRIFPATSGLPRAFFPSLGRSRVRGEKGIEYEDHLVSDRCCNQYSLPTSFYCKTME